MAQTNNYQESVAQRIQQEKLAVQFIKNINDLYLDKGIETVLFRNQLVDQRPSEVLNLHSYARNIVGQNITITDTVALLDELVQMDLAPARMDIGRLASEWLNEGSNFASVSEFLNSKLADFIGPDNMERTTPKDVVLYGFGRIGRLVARELMAQEGMGEQLRLRAVVSRGETPESLEKRASLLRVDSVHGNFPGTVEADVENMALIINGREIKFINAAKPEDIDYTAYGINDALIIDNTGAFRDEAALSRHLQAKGAAKVLLTAPGKGVPNIVHGVNQMDFDPSEVNIFSAASCTTNAITPVLKVIEDAFGVERGHIETVHAYTNDQNLVDNMHKKYRRGRAAALNMVITETGAGAAVAKALPVMAGKLTSNAIRVPVPNGSLAILNLEVKNATDLEGVNNAMRNAALKGDLVEQIKYSMSNELVSSDIVGESCPSIFDSPATIVDANGKNMVLYVWYDNEYGYSRQVIRLSKYIAQVRRKRYY
ncbi:glyceraldehyde-3-phosphate dehydrogenase [Croceimicrobium hydrocarbonivorans]|uniref:Glyceraldehyde-3-phosphate dehydrogenase n=1 Tax=Croceimicrobium hydrocarbonivorans TaxID=2761580 RepID=A0A7H0VD14_9FLAO|nr:glyceraldehyde-3-phosphate dehydrogenase [Croceimicrobium hydrocarbonivorans]QNR23612.1 glyceraldehyde-3-phosphate dehydrogenase [Croceimicrobium hydrocarbonivorans]